MTTLPRLPSTAGAVEAAPDGASGRAAAEADVATRHGVPHVVVPGPGPVRARLLFRVGAVDESVQERGLTHLVEHLTMRAVGRRPIEVDAGVGMWSTGFEATGAVADVEAFLSDVWSALAAVPLDGLAREKAVLGHEGEPGVSPVELSAHHRYGVTGPGRAWPDQLGVGGADEETVRRWVRSRFVRGAAALVATADVRPDLSAPLPEGPVQPVPLARTVRGGHGPLWVGDAGGTAISLLLPTRDGLDLAVGRLLRTAAEDLVRHDRALAYEVGMDTAPVSPSSCEVAVYTDCDEAAGPEVAGLLVGLLRRMRDHGPTEQELAHERASTLSVWRETPDALELATEHAVALLTGERPRTTADRVGAAESLDAGTVREVLQEAWPTLQVLVHDADPGIDGVSECLHRDEPVPGRRHRANPLAWLPGPRLGAPWSTWLVAGVDGITMRSVEEVLTVRWDEVAAVLRVPEGVVVLGRNGNQVLVSDGTFLGGRALRRAVEGNVPVELFVDGPGHG